MEDPEARRARLKAMREQAEGVSQSAPIPDNTTAKLANPFEEAAPATDAHTPRFNYYSNPAAGFVHTKRKDPGHSPGAQPPVNAARPHGNWRPKFYPPAPVPPQMAPQVGGFGSPIPLYHPQGFAPPPPALEPLQRPGEGTWPIKRPNFGPGRGAGRGFEGRGSGPGRGGFGRNQGNQARGRGGGSISARDRPDLFYQKSMVEDPWRHLLP